MSPKELLYLEDALGHQSFLTDWCRDAAQRLEQPALGRFTEQLADSQQDQFCQLFGLLR